MRSCFWFLLACLLTGSALPSCGAIAYVQSTKTAKGNAGNPTASFSSTPTVGDLVVASVACYAAANCNVSSFSDNQSNTYTMVAKNIGYFSTQATVSLYYSIITTASGTFTVTANLTASEDSTLMIAEYSGIASASPVDISTTATGSSTLATATMTTTNANDLLVDVVGVGGSAATPTAGSGFTMRQSNGSNSELMGLEDKTVSVAGSQTATMNTPNSDWASIVVAFQQAVAAPTILSRPRPIWIQ